MQICSVIVGLFTCGADLLRRAMGKKNATKWPRQRESLRARCRRTTTSNPDLGNKDIRLRENLLRYGLINHTPQPMHVSVLSDALAKNPITRLKFMAAVMSADNGTTLTK